MISSTSSLGAPDNASRGFFSRSLGRKLSLVVTMAVLAGMSLLVLVLTGSMRSSLEAQADAADRKFTKVLAGQLAAAVRFDQRQAIDRAFSNLQAEENTTFVGAAVFDADGEAMVEFVPEGWSSTTFSSNADAFALDEENQLASTNFQGNHLVAIPVFAPGGDAPIGSLAVMWSRSILEAEVKGAITTGGVIAVFMIIGLVGVLSFATNRIVLQPLAGIVERMTALVAGELATPIPHRDRADEIGSIAGALERFRDDARAMEELRRRKEADAVASEAARKRLLSDVADKIEVRVGDVAQRMVATAGALKSHAQGLETAVGDVSEDVDQVAGGITSVAERSDAVGRSIDNLISVVSDIAQGVESASEAASASSRQASDARQELSSLVDAIKQVGETVSLIEGISEQTNLLALNATIEAARAGDMGRGFAVVAGEVKALAEQTGKLTERICDNIETVDRSAKKAIETTGIIISDVQDISDKMIKITVSIDQQNQKINKTNQDIKNTSSSVSSVFGSIEAVRSSTDTASGVVSEVRSIAKSIDQSSASLNDEVLSLMREVRM